MKERWNDGRKRTASGSTASEEVLWRRRKKELKAVDDVSFTIYKGETFGLWESPGGGKTTCGRTCIGVYDATEGEVFYRGKDIRKQNKKERKDLPERYR